MNLLFDSGSYKSYFEAMNTEVQTQTSEIKCRFVRYVNILKLAYKTFDASVTTLVNDQS